MTRNEYTVDELADVLLRAGFVECNIAACNCGSWHHRYGLPERFSEIKDALMDAGVLNNETGNLPIRAIAKLVEQRDALRSRLAEAESRQTCEGTQPYICHALATARSRLAEVETERDIRLAQVETHVQANVRLEARLAEAERLLQEVYDGRQSLMSVGLVYRIGHTLNHRAADSATHREAERE